MNVLNTNEAPGSEKERVKKCALFENVRVKNVQKSLWVRVKKCIFATDTKN